MGTEETTIKITRDRDVLITHRNAFQKTLLDNVLDMRRHQAIKEIKPDYQRKNQAGKYIGIDELIDDYRKGAANAKSYVDIIDDLLELDRNKNLASSWAGVYEGEKKNVDGPSELMPEEAKEVEEVEEVETEEDGAKEVA